MTYLINFDMIGFFPNTHLKYVSLVSTENTAMELLIAKILSLLAIGLVSLAFGLLPHYIVRWFTTRGQLRTPRVRTFIACVICFSGGTILGVAFLHLMPDMRDKLRSLGLEGYWKALPIGDVITCGGFFFVYIVDELMHMFIEWYSSRRETLDWAMEHVEDVTTSSDRERTTAWPRGTVYHEHEHDRHSFGHPLEAVPNVPPFTAIITIVALSFHDIFEGLAIGIEDNVKNVLFLYLSVAAHKYIIAFCIGMDLVLSGLRPMYITLYLLTFSMVSPLGIVVGIFTVATGTDQNVNVDSVVTVVLQGVAGGTLIYVVCFEILQREGSTTHARGILNVLFVLIGFLLTLCFKVMLGHSHATKEACRPLRAVD